MDKQAFWYSMGVALGMRATKYVYGTVEAVNEYKALDMLDKQAVQEHGGPLKEARLHRVNTETGEKADDACLIVSPEDGSESYLDKAGPQSKKLTPSEESAVGPSPPAFGRGWARKLTNPNPVISLKHKE